MEKRYALQRGDVMNQQLTVQQKLALEQAKRQSAIDVNKATLDYATSKDTRADQLAQFNAQQNFQIQMQTLQNQYNAAQDQYKLQFGAYSQNLQNQFTQQQQQLQNQYNASQQASQNQFTVGQNTQDQQAAMDRQLASQQANISLQSQQDAAALARQQELNASKTTEVNAGNTLVDAQGKTLFSAPANVGNQTAQQLIANMTPVALPNGTTVYIDKSGKAFDSKGIPVANETISNSKAETAPVSSTTKSTTNLGPTTPTQKQTIAQAGLTNSPPEAQSYFLNTPKEFQDSWQRQIAPSLQASPNQSFTLQDVIDNYTSWYNVQQDGERSV